jgi:hypothetical protein
MKNKLLLVLSLVFILMFTLTACAKVTSLLGSTGGETKPASDVLFQDDFSNTSSGWDKYTDATGSTDYVDGTYQIYVNDVNYDLWANPGKTFTDVIVEVDATKVSGPENNDFGVICRYQDSENYYFGFLASDGYYSIGKVVANEQSLFEEGGMAPTTAVKAGNVSNHVRMDCVGSKLSLYVNGTLLSEVEDTNLTSGDVGLIAGTFEEAGTKISFDNFVVRKP